VSESFAVLDAVGFDLHVALQISEAANLVILRWYKLHFDEDFDHPNQRRRANLLRGYSTRLHILKGVVHWRVGGQGSGVAHTEVHNGLMNRIMDKMEFKHHYPNLDYDTYVRTLLYGDDKVRAVHKHCSKCTPRSFHEFWLERGMEWKLPDGSTPTDEFLPRSRLEFISRTPQEIGGFIFGVLPQSTIKEIALWVRTKDPNQVTSLMRQGMESALIEAALHGAPFYGALRAVFNKCLTKLGLSPLTATWESQMSAILARRC
jgi:hypothetical protein